MRETEPRIVSDALVCPSCGAPVDGGARHCSYCNGLVATVRCGGCFHMNSPDATYCSGCGRELGLEPVVGAGSIACPSCAHVLTAFAGGPGKLYDCGGCGGQLVEHALLRDLLERREICGAAIPRRELARPGVLAPVKYLPCPECHALMNRHNFGGTSGVIVDLCAKHGVWFDTGELPRVLEFVESGGLARARRVELERLEQARHELRDHAVDLSADAPSGGGPGYVGTTGALSHAEPPAWSSGLWEDAKEAVMAVLHQLGEQIAKR